MLGVHHIDETVPASQLIYYDIAFLVWGAAMLFTDWHIFQSGQREIRMGHSADPQKYNR